MALKLSQQDIADMARAGTLREQGGKRVLPMSPMIRNEPAPPAKSPAEEPGHDCPPSIDPAAHMIAQAIDRNTEAQKELCGLLEKILNQCLQSRAN